MRTFVTRSGVLRRSLAGGIPRTLGTPRVREQIQRKDDDNAAARAAAPLATGTLTSDGFTDWHYVAFLKQRTVLLARNVSSTNRSSRIGTIPWITRNPGNITVSTAKDAGAGAKEAFKHGAYGKGGGRQLGSATRRYAIFPDVASGLAAIWPQLELINDSNGGKLTLLGAMKIFKGVDRGENEDVKRQYVEEITTLLTDIVLEHGDSEEGAEAGEGPTRAQAEADARAILNTPVKDLDAADVRFDMAREALVNKEGGLEAPGVGYHCDDGFAANARKRYSESQWKAIQALKAAAPVEAELRSLLGCGD